MCIVQPLQAQTVVGKALRLCMAHIAALKLVKVRHKMNLLHKQGHRTYAGWGELAAADTRSKACTFSRLFIWIFKRTAGRTLRRALKENASLPCRWQRCTGAGWRGCVRSGGHRPDQPGLENLHLLRSQHGWQGTGVSFKTPEAPAPLKPIGIGHPPFSTVSELYGTQLQLAPVKLALHRTHYEKLGAQGAWRYTRRCGYTCRAVDYFLES